MSELPTMLGMQDQDMIIHLLTRFVDRTNSYSTMREAAIYLARTNWDLEEALVRWMNPHPEDGTADEVESGESDQGSEEGSSEQETSSSDGDVSIV